MSILAMFSYIVDEAEIVALFKKFKKLDSKHTGGLTAEDFSSLPELENNPLIKRVVSTFDRNHDGTIDFFEFIQSLSIFAGDDESSDESKNQFLFHMYDVDNDGFISNADLFQILKAMVGNNLNDIQLQQLVDRTIRQGDKDLDGKLSYKEFMHVIENQDVKGKLKCDLFKDQTKK
jgi:serine/threonine-protein phosphatase 2B regulatory subunit